MLTRKTGLDFQRRIWRKRLGKLGTTREKFHCPLRRCLLTLLGRLLSRRIDHCCSRPAHYISQGFAQLSPSIESCSFMEHAIRRTWVERQTTCAGREVGRLQCASSALLRLWCRQARKHGGTAHSSSFWWQPILLRPGALMQYTPHLGRKARHWQPSNEQLNPDCAIQFLEVSF